MRELLSDSGLTILFTAVVNGSVMLAVLSVKLSELRREVTRAHRRLDVAGVENVTVDL